MLLALLAGVLVGGFAWGIWKVFCGVILHFILPVPPTHCHNHFSFVRQRILPSMLTNIPHLPYSSPFSTPRCSFSSSFYHLSPSTKRIFADKSKDGTLELLDCDVPLREPCYILKSPSLKTFYHVSLFSRIASKTKCFLYFVVSIFSTPFYLTKSLLTSSVIKKHISAVALPSLQLMHFSNETMSLASFNSSSLEKLSPSSQDMQPVSNAETLKDKRKLFAIRLPLSRFFGKWSFISSTAYYNSNTFRRIRPPLTLVIDLDKTLLFASKRQIYEEQVAVEVCVDNHQVEFFVLKRPYIELFIRQMYPLYEIVIYTAARPEYADVMLDFLGINLFVERRLSRDDCDMLEGSYVKDLRKARNNTEKVILLDDLRISAKSYPDNLVLVKAFVGQRDDRELFDLLPFLCSLSTCKHPLHILKLQRMGDVGPPF